MRKKKTKTAPGNPDDVELADKGSEKLEGSLNI